MRILFAFCLLAASTAFRPMVAPKHSSTKLDAVSRRDLLAAAAILAVPQAAGAVSHAIQNREGSHTHGSTWFFDENIEKVREESQMPTGNKLDLNNAAVVRFVVRLVLLHDCCRLWGSHFLFLSNSSSKHPRFAV